MVRPSSTSRRPRRPPVPLDAQRLEELALTYVARFATSAGRLASYCRRKLRERGHAGAEEGEVAPNVEELVARFVAKGFVDDEGFARAKSGSLLRRGYGARRVDQALRADVIAETLREAVAPDETERREAAAAYARRRRLGPYSSAPLDATDRSAREKQLAALLRAGHDPRHARHVLAAASPSEVEEWVEEAREGQDPE